MIVSAPADVTVVIVTFNSAKVIGGCLSSLPNECRVVCVDNASTDDTLAVINATKPDAVVLVNHENFGFGCACNIGASMGSSSFVLLLNPDARLQKNALEEMLNAAARYPDAAIIAPLLFFENNQPQLSYRNSIFAARPLFLRKRWGKYVVPEGEICADFVSGACMLVRMSCFGHEPLFDENIFMFYEDDDLCLRTRNKGFSIILTPQASVLHQRGASSGFSAKSEALKNYHFTKSRIYLENKYNGAGEALWLAVKLTLKHFFKCMIACLSLNAPKARKEFYRSAGAWRAISHSVWRGVQPLLREWEQAV